MHSIAQQSRLSLVEDMLESEKLLLLLLLLLLFIYAGIFLFFFSAFELA